MLGCVKGCYINNDIRNLRRKQILIKLHLHILERQVKLAYVETEAKPPPQVRRKQAKFGTGKGVASIEPPVKISSRDRPSTSSSHRSSSQQSTKKSAGKMFF